MALFGLLAHGGSPSGAPVRGWWPCPVQLLLRHPGPRVVTLVVMALLASGLVLLRFAPDSGSVAVLEGAKAGDLVIHRCDYATEDASQAADCGTHVVPQNRADSQSRLISATGDPPGSAVGSASGAGLLP